MKQTTSTPHLISMYSNTWHSYFRKQVWENDGLHTAGERARRYLPWIGTGSSMNVVSPDDLEAWP